MKRTPLYQTHVSAQAKLVDCAGWEMPIQYSGVVDEYQTVRTAAGLFDVNRMVRGVPHIRLIRRGLFWQEQ
ncbi:MAG: hypothetical protein HY444_07600 [Nitrospirae bacterium]|nr:hypothetical protein [Nitrospirota bacterium]